MMYTYNPRKVTCAFGSHNVTGFSEDSMIAIEYSGDGTSHVTGADGETVRSIDPSCTFGIKISLLQTSKTNAFLKERYKMDQDDGNGMFSVTIKDILGNEQFTSPSAWVTKPAGWTRGKAQSDVEWEIVAADGKFN